MNREQFVQNVVALMCAEHGADQGSFEELEPYIAAAHATEGTITDSDLMELCCGEETPERRELEERYPKLTRVFESVFDGERPFPMPRNWSLGDRVIVTWGEMVNTIFTVVAVDDEHVLGYNGTLQSASRAED